jgi:hypothetical protein
MMMARNGDHRGISFPLEFQKVLVSRETDYARLSRSMAKRGYQLSKQFIGAIGTGSKKVPSEQLKRICETLRLDEQERRRLHRAAAIDHGFDVGGLDA